MRTGPYGLWRSARPLVVGSLDVQPRAKAARPTTIVAAAASRVID